MDFAGFKQNPAVPRIKDESWSPLPEFFGCTNSPQMWIIHWGSTYSGRNGRNDGGLGKRICAGGAIIEGKSFVLERGEIVEG